MHLHGKDISSVRLNERCSMVRNLVVKLQRLRPGDGDCAKRPNDKKAPVPRVVVSSGRTALAKANPSRGAIFQFALPIRDEEQIPPVRIQALSIGNLFARLASKYLRHLF